MLQQISQLMPSLLQVVNPRSMTESDFLEAPCKNRCGEFIPSHWDESSSKWVYDRECFTCSQKASQQHRYRQGLTIAGITDQETQLTLDKFVVDDSNEKAYDAARCLASGMPINLFLHGRAGRGKTHLALGVALAHVSTKRVKFMSVTKALMNIRGNLRETSEDEYISRMLNSDILVMDDFGANKLTEWNLSFMDCLIDEWYRQRKSGLVITSNFGLRYISENISDRIASRLAYLCEVHELGGDDHRLSSPTGSR